MGDAETTTELDAARPRRNDSRLEVLAQVKRGLGLPVAPLVFGRYTLRHELGAGGLGIVYAAHDPELDRDVAIKFLRGERTPTSAESPPRLLREAQAIARLAHPNVIAVFDVCTYGPDDRPERVGAAPHGVFLVMELVDGLDLHQWLRAGPHAWRKVVEIFLGAGRGLAAAHDHGLVHRDFKPSNVLVGRDGRPRVLDFGLARAHGDARDETIEGTPAYMSPEQAAGADVDVRTDVFAFCVALRDALRGAAAPGRMPAGLRDVLERGVARDRDARPGSMHAVIRALERALTRRRRVALAFAGVAIAGLAGLAGHAAWAEHRALVHCEEAEATATALWAEPVATAVSDRFVATGSPAATDAFDRVDRAVSDRLRAWTELRVDACKSLVRDPARLDAVGPQIVCLDRALGRLEGVIDLLGQADGDVVVRSVAAVDAIRPERDCTAALADAELPPPDFDAELERAIAHAEGLAGLGNVAAAVEAWQALLAEHETIAEASKSRVLLGLAAAQTGVGDYAAADRSLHEAMRAAERAGDELAGLRVLELRARVALLHGRIDDARDYAQWAEARASRGTFAPRYAASIALLLAGAAYEAGDRDQAERIAERVRAEAEALSDADLESKAERTLGVVAAAAGRYDDGLAHHRRAVEIEIDTHGRYSPTVASELINVADLELRLEQLDSVESTLAHIREVVAAGRNKEHPIAVLADLLEAQLRLAHGHAHEAASLAERGAGGAERAFGSTHRHTGMAYSVLANALVSDDRNEEALVAARHAIAIFEAGPHHSSLTGALTVAASALDNLERDAEAIELYDRAIAVETEAGDATATLELASAYASRAQLQLARGELELARSDAERAVALCAGEDDAPGCVDARALVHPLGR